MGTRRFDRHMDWEDLTNEVVQELIEALIDALDAMERKEEPTRPFGEVKQEIHRSRGVNHPN